MFIQDDMTPPTLAPPPEHTPPDVPDCLLADDFEHSELNGKFYVNFLMYR